MSKRIRDMRLNEDIEGKYALVNIQEPKEYNGGKRMVLKIRDKYLDEITVTYWGNKDEDLKSLYDSLKDAKCVSIRGHVTENRGNGALYISVSKNFDNSIKATDDYDLNDCLMSIDELPWLDANAEDMKEEFFSIISAVENRYLKELLNNVFSGEFWDKFYIATASQKFHSAGIHGLLHHTLNVTKIARAVAALYPSVDIDLITAGALLHDIGKVWEYEFTPTIEYSDDGKMLGHIYMGAEMVSRKIDEIENFPLKLKKELLHIILSHHDLISMGWGSARDPSTPEAVIVAHADNMDAKTYSEVRKKEGKLNKN